MSASVSGASVSGDPGSCSQTGGSLRRLAVGLRSDLDRVSGAYAALGRVWSGPASVRARKRGDALVAVTEGASSEADRVGAALQEYAQDLAEAVTASRSIGERAAAMGLLLECGRVTLAWGVSGEADHARAAEVERNRETLQREHDLVVLQLERRRARMTAVVAASQESLAGASTRLRAL